MKRNWKFFNGLMRKSKKVLHKEIIVYGISTNDTSEIGNYFCIYFIDHPRNIHESIPYSSSHYLETYILMMVYVFQNVIETEILECIMCLIKEGGINDISRKFLVMCKNHNAYHLNGLLNFCIASGVYSSIFKFIQITPIYKKGSLHYISNYKPVSVLKDLYKGFENIIYNRLQNFCQTSNFLAKNQFGFRKNRNTELAALSLLDKLLPALKEENFTICVSLDYSVCFDILSRSKLFDKLERYGIRGVSLDFMKAYFSNRSKFVCYNSVTSCIKNQDLGVIQR